MMRAIREAGDLRTRRLAHEDRFGKEGPPTSPSCQHLRRNRRCRPAWHVRGRCSALHFRRAGILTSSLRAGTESRNWFLQITRTSRSEGWWCTTRGRKEPFSSCMGFQDLVRWKDISLALADDYEIHAFDWPGYGLSSRPTVDRFSYAPKDYAHVLNEYVGKAGIDTSKLTIYATISEHCLRFFWPWKNPTSRGRSSLATSPRSTGPVTCTRACKPEGGALDRPGPRPAEQKSRGYPRKCFQKRFAQEAQFEVSRS